MHSFDYLLAVALLTSPTDAVAAVACPVKKIDLQAMKRTAFPADFSAYRRSGENGAPRTLYCPGEVGKWSASAQRLSRPNAGLPGQHRCGKFSPCIMTASWQLAATPRSTNCLPRNNAPLAGFLGTSWAPALGRRLIALTLLLIFLLVASDDAVGSVTA